MPFYKQLLITKFFTEHFKINNYDNHSINDILFTLMKLLIDLRTLNISKEQIKE